MRKRRKSYPSETHVGWGLRGLTKSAAMEFAPWNIRVNAVHPGIVDTPIIAGFKRCCLKSKRFDGAQRDDYF